MTYKKPLGIKSWSVADRPREKYKRLGSQQLTDAELLAIIIGNGYTGQSALSVSKTILSSLGQELHKLYEMPLSKLQKYKGIGMAKAIKIKASLDMGHRLVSRPAMKTQSITSSHAAYQELKPVLMGLPHEAFWVLYLNNANTIIEKAMVSKGGFTQTVVDIRVVLKQAIGLGAVALIAAHNHPSGNITPSAQDKALTEKLKTAAQTVDIRLLDHIIIGKGEYFSFADQELL